MLARPLARRCALALALFTAALASGCALIPCQPYTCADSVCGCLPAGPLVQAVPASAARAPSELAPTSAPAGDTQGF
jgi:hypothetical protein